MSDGWERRQVPLKFGAGDWAAFAIPVDLHVRSVRLAERLPAAGDPAVPVEPALGDAAGYMLRALPVAEPLPTVRTANGYIRYVTAQYRHCFIDLSIGMAAYRSKFSAKTRSTIARKVRKFQETCGGVLDWRTYRQPAEMTEFHRLARELSARTYQERLLDAGIPDSPTFVDGMLQLAARDEVRGWILFDRGRPVSYLYCPAHQGTLVYSHLGYDPEYVKHSAGTVLQWLAIEQLYGEGHFTLFDFTEGQSDHKLLFATHTLQCANLMFLRRTLTHTLLVWAHATGTAATSRVGLWAEGLGVKSRLKRLLRFGLASS